ncbi:DoxX family protein [Serratia marcescens]|uniref:DoxX family protein n=1 Tax=Serratia marcescens TaxID=615 RepID=UPI0027E48586|nr:DoxX family protein [Serratia marcescens]MDI3226789.1 DoxX family protein [Serratia marcescens]HEN7339079.1 DoxX family protein [Serratia marcescens]HEN7409108.1 DoxX family protein [Serratia marcescens]
MQRFINTALDSYWLWLLARLCLIVIFISSGLAKLFDIEGSLAEMRAAGLHPAWLFNLASAAVLLTGSVLILLNRWVWLGAGMLSVFLILTIAIVHTFWNMSAPNMQISLYFALEHITVIGGLWVTAIASRLRQRLANTREAA